MKYGSNRLFGSHTFRFAVFRGSNAMRKGGRNCFWLYLVTRNKILVMRLNQNHQILVACRNQNSFFWLRFVTRKFTISITSGVLVLEQIPSSSHPVIICENLVLRLACTRVRISFYRCLIIRRLSCRCSCLWKPDQMKYIQEYDCVRCA